MNHFHVRWGNLKWDWEAFETEEAAKAQGERLKRPGESYDIEERDGDCHLCSKLKPDASRRTNSNLA